MLRDYFPQMGQEAQIPGRESRVQSTTQQEMRLLMAQGPLVQGAWKHPDLSL